MADRVERLGNSWVQHGAVNGRIYLMKLDTGDVPGILRDLDELARGRGYGKICVKIPASAEAVFAAAGYRREALVPGFFGGREAAGFMARYPDPERGVEWRPDAVAGVLELVRRLVPEAMGGTGLPDREPISAEAGEGAPISASSSADSSGEVVGAGESDFRLRVLAPADASDMAALYREVFRSYPFPIFDPAYLRASMENHVRYVGAEYNGTLAAIASAEMAPADRNAEMTDFATRPEFRRRGLAQRLLARMEREVRGVGIRTAYTIARAGSAGMNLTFARSGYLFGGTLVNNTHIAGGIESMNVWYKTLGGCGRAKGYR